MGCGLVVAGGLLFLLAALWPAVKRDMQAHRAALCQGNLRALYVAVDLYLAENSDRFPLGNTWCDAITPYLPAAKIETGWSESEYPFVCPNAPRLRCGYAFNSSLSGTSMQSLRRDGPSVVLLFESDAGWNAAGGPSLLTPRPRHDGGTGDNYVLIRGPDSMTALPEARPLPPDAARWTQP